MRGDSSGLRLSVRERGIRGNVRGSRHHVHRPDRRDNRAHGGQDSRGATRGGDRLPRVPGSGVSRGCTLRAIPRSRIGYPVLLKASAGGGGRGMRVVSSEAEIVARMEAAAAEALAAFGDRRAVRGEIHRAMRGTSRSRSWATATATSMHLGERECSTQRRHQKLIEESPSRVDRRDHAVELARRRRHALPGASPTVAPERSSSSSTRTSRQAYFLEMNTRIQVEHPVTEMVTGRDLVVEQIRVAAGKPLPSRKMRCGGTAMPSNAVSMRRTPTAISRRRRDVSIDGPRPQDAGYAWTRIAFPAIAFRPITTRCLRS